MLLHWCLVVALVVAILTGLRIAAESPDRTWINNFDSILPRQLVWTTHMQSAVGLVAVALAYPIYVALAGLTRRIRFDRVRLAGLLGCRQARCGAINVALYWALYFALLCEMVTGALLYFDYGSSLTITLHWSGMWLIVGCTVGHVLVHWQLGAAPQLLRIVRPMRLQPQPLTFDPIDLLELFDQNSLKPERNHGLGATTLQSELDTIALRRQSSRSRTHGPERAREISQTRCEQPSPRGRVAKRAAMVRCFNRIPSSWHSATAIVGTSLLVTAEHQTSQSLEIRRIDAADVPILDGDTSDRVWRLAKPLFIPTGHGRQFRRKG